MRTKHLTSLLKKGQMKSKKIQVKLIMILFWIIIQYMKQDINLVWVTIDLLDKY